MSVSLRISGAGVVELSRILILTVVALTFWPILSARSALDVPVCTGRRKLAPSFSRPPFASPSFSFGLADVTCTEENSGAVSGLPDTFLEFSWT